MDEETEEKIDSEVFSSTSIHKDGAVLSVVCPLCEAPIEATLIETSPKRHPKALPSLFLVYTNKQCDCPDVSLHYREDKVVGPTGPTGTSYGF
jgi:hypothetical protein